MKKTIFAIICCAISCQTYSTNPKISLNLADEKILTHSIKGIGTKRAQAIIKYRQDHGRFKSIDELAQVKGLGKSFVQAHNKELQEKFMI